MSIVSIIIIIKLGPITHPDQLAIMSRVSSLELLVEEGKLGPITHLDLWMAVTFRVSSLGLFLEVEGMMGPTAYLEQLQSLNFTSVP